MEMFFGIVLILSLTFSVCTCAFLYFRIVRIEKNSHKFQKQNQEIVNSFGDSLDEIEIIQVKISQQIDDIPHVIKNDIERSLLDFKEMLEPTKPMKTNNWDSVREAFKGPIRIDLNERN